MKQPITVTALVAAPLEVVWEYWTKEEHITQWNAASDDWHTPHAENDLRVGGLFSARMEARDGSEGFDFTGTYTEVTPPHSIKYTMDDGRCVSVVFEEHGSGTHITEQFDPEDSNPESLQRDGWQAILDNFKKYVEGSRSFI